MTHVLILPIVLPLVAAALIVALPVRAKRVQRTINVVATLALLPVALWLVTLASRGGIATYTPGAWPAPFGIVLQLDRLGALMLALTALLACCCLLGTSSADARRGRYLRALFQFELMGLNGAFLAGDLFNLFVFFELLLIASYALLLHGGGRARVRHGLHYLLMNLVGSSFFLVALGVLYGLTGTLNMADMGARLAQLDAGALPLARFAGATLMLVFGLKAAVFPMSFWLPQAYRSAIGPVAALFAIMTKVGVYAMLRCDALVFGAAGGLLDAFLHDWAWWLAIATIGFGALGALSVSSLKTTTGYLVLVSVGLLIAAVTLQTVAAWSALLYYLISTTLCTGALFLLADTLEPEAPGAPASEPASFEALDDVGRAAAIRVTSAAAAPRAAAPEPAARAAATTTTVAAEAATAGTTAIAAPVLQQDEEAARTHAAAAGQTTDAPPWPSHTAALIFLIAAVGAVGLPPLSGFLGKAMVLAATPPERAVVLWPAVLVSSLLLIVAMSRTGTRLLWAIPASRGYADAASAGPAARARPSDAPPGSRAKLAASALLLACAIAITLGAGPLERYLDATAAQLLDRAGYVRAVLPAGGS